MNNTARNCDPSPQPTGSARPGATRSGSGKGGGTRQPVCRPVKPWPGNAQPEAAAPPGARRRPHGRPTPRKGAWSSTPGAGSKAGTQGDDVDQMRRDDRYLAAMVSSVPLAAGEDGRADLALAQEIHAAVEPKDIFDRWRVEDLFHGYAGARRAIAPSALSCRMRPVSRPLWRC